MSLNSSWGSLLSLTRYPNILSSAVAVQTYIHPSFNLSPLTSIPRFLPLRVHLTSIHSLYLPTYASQPISSAFSLSMCLPSSMTLSMPPSVSPIHSYSNRSFLPPPFFTLFVPSIHPCPLSVLHLSLTPSPYFHFLCPSFRLSFQSSFIRPSFPKPVLSHRCSLAGPKPIFLLLWVFPSPYSYLPSLSPFSSLFYRWLFSLISFAVVGISS